MVILWRAFTYLAQMRTSTEKHRDTKTQRHKGAHPRFFLRAFVPLCLCASVFFIPFESSISLPSRGGVSAIYFKAKTNSELPAAISMYCFPANENVIGPEMTRPPTGNFHSNLPSRASSA